VTKRTPKRVSERPARQGDAPEKNNRGPGTGRARPSSTRATAQSDAGQGAGATKGAAANRGAAPPERRSGRLLLRRDAAQRIGKPKATEDEQFLERKPAGRPEFLDSDPWRALRILSEFVEGFDALAAVGPAVTMFGSARIAAGAPMYELGRTIARRLAESGFAIITGGGPGIMEAANRGCREGGGLSIGCNIELPHEQFVNPYVDLGIEFRYFGTLDELFESLTLIQTGKVRDFPVVLVGRDYWEGLLDWMREVQLPAGAIAAGDIDLLKVTDDPGEVVAIVRSYAARVHGDVAGTPPG
jgi:hypothetical protein